MTGPETEAVGGAPVEASRVLRHEAQGSQWRDDWLAVEEPLEIHLRWRAEGEWREQPFTLTMRTPGDDIDLVTGLLFSEGIVTDKQQIVTIAGGDNPNQRVVELATGHQLDLKRFQRQFASTASCGVCGKIAIETLRLLHEPQLAVQQPCIHAAVLQQLPQRLREAQGLFARTGGVHAAALFSPAGELLLMREDIGRHNAVDKLIGACRYGAAAELRDGVLLVSGRAGFELVQKALVSDIAVMAAVGAPSSLAVRMAQAYGMTLAGFLKAGSFNCYSGEQRIVM